MYLDTCIALPVLEIAYVNRHPFGFWPLAKGCSQRPGYDYQETFSPVVRMETVRAILSLVPSKKLKIQQMDVKGAYLNGILKEKVYMKQASGHEVPGKEN